MAAAGATLLHPAPLHQHPLRMLILAIITSHAVAFNSSGFLPSLLLKDVVGEIAKREKWDPEAVRVSDVDGGSVVVGRSRRHEFQVRVGRRALLVFTFPEEVDGSAWKKPRGRDGGKGWWSRLGEPARWPRPRLKSFDLEGLLEVKAVGDGRFSLLLPTNTTHTSIKRVLVGEGIAMKVEGAQEVTISYPSNSGLSLDGNLLTTDYGRMPFWLHGYSFCAPLLSVHIRGSASLVAYKTRNTKAWIETVFPSPDTVELLPEKCYSGSPRPDLSLSRLSLGSRLNLLKRILRSLLGKKISQFGTPHFLRAKIIPSILVKFRLELERDIGDNDRIWRKVPERRTRPTMEWDWFQVLARAEVGRGLKPVFVRKLARPIITTDSASWSSLLSNISFTQLQSILVPPEALTLDVMW